MNERSDEIATFALFILIKVFERSPVPAPFLPELLTLLQVLICFVFVIYCQGNITESKVL